MLCDSVLSPPPARRRSMAFATRWRPAGDCMRCSSIRRRHAGVLTFDCRDPARIKSHPRQPSVKPALRKSESKGLSPRVRGGAGAGGGTLTSKAMPGSTLIRMRVSWVPGLGWTSVPCSKVRISGSHLSDSTRLRMHLALTTCPVASAMTTALLFSISPKNHPSSKRAAATGSLLPATVKG